MKPILFCCGLLSFFIMNANAQLSDNLNAFEPLIGKTWEINAHWGNGNPFSQVISYESGLDEHIVIAHTASVIDEESGEWGQKSHGIRQHDPNSGSMRFWEFDRSGNVTLGLVECSEGEIHYIYAYDTPSGAMRMRDRWVPAENGSYLFFVEQLDENGEVINTFLEGEFAEKLN